MNPKDIPTLALMQALLAVVECGGMVPAERQGRGHRANLSRSIAELEQLVGTKLVERNRRFHVYRAGHELADGFAAGLDLIARVVAKVRNEARPLLQVVSAEVVAQQYLPDILHELEKQHPNLRCSTDSGNEAQLRRMVRDGEATLAIAAYQPAWQGFGRADLLAVRPHLIYPRSWPARTTKQLWEREIITETLFYSAAFDTLVTTFDAGLNALGIKWPNRTRVASVRCVMTAVAKGHGFGLTADVAGLVNQPGIRRLALNFEPFPLCAFWHGPRTPQIQLAVAAMQKVAAEIAA